MAQTLDFGEGGLESILKRLGVRHWREIGVGTAVPIAARIAFARGQL